MPFYAKNRYNEIWKYPTGYTAQTSLGSVPNSSVARLNNGIYEGSAARIAPNLFLSAWHVTQSAPASQYTVNLASSTVGQGADTATGSEIINLRRGNRNTNDLSLLKTAGNTSLPSGQETLGMYVSSRGNAHDVAMLQSAYTIGHPGLYADAAGTIEAGPGQYRLNVNASAPFSSGAPATWKDDAATGASGNSGGPLFVTETSGDLAGRIFVTGNMTWANATGPINGAKGIGPGVGGMLLTTAEKQRIDKQIKLAGNDAYDVAIDVLQGSDTADNQGVTSADGAALAGSFKRELIRGNGGADLIYTGSGAPDVKAGATTAVAERSGDSISGGAGPDTIVLGPGQHRILSETAGDRSADRLAVLVESVNYSATADGAAPDAADDRAFILAGGLRMTAYDNNAYQYVSRTATSVLNNGYPYDELTTDAYGEPIGILVNYYRMGPESWDFTYDIGDANYVGDIRVEIHAVKQSFWDRPDGHNRFVFSERPDHVDPQWDNSNFFWSATLDIENFHNGDFGLSFLNAGNTTATFNQGIAALSRPLVDIPDVDGPYGEVPPSEPTPIAGTNANDLLGGDASREITRAGAGNDTVNGAGGDDDLFGEDGNDYLDGGAGSDLLVGGLGNDTFVVDAEFDTVEEYQGEGADEIRTSLASYQLELNVEVLRYTGTGSFAGYGNDSANELIGASGADSLSAAGGDDTINGAGGNDTLDGGTGTDTAQFGFARTAYTASQSAGVINLTHTASGAVATISNVENFQFTDGTFTAAQLLAAPPTGTAGNDTLTGTSGADNLSGLGGNDSISGLDGNDTLDGGTGTDTLIGGLGNDVYVVDVAADVVTEAASAGTDEVRTALASYTLGTNLENLTGTAATGQALTGNAAANLLTGSGGNDTLDGGTGIDTLVGGLGNDVYLVDVATDVVTEAASAGTDEVRTALASYTLGTNLETLTGTAATGQALTGNAAANLLTGSGGNDTLDGGTGIDTLVGGLGNDIYLVDVATDVVTEAASAGTDEVRTALASYTLGANLETLTGTAATGQALTGNTGANRIAGLGGNDTLDGGTGTDTLVGGLGNDVYVVDVATDVVTEAASAGTDEVRTALASYTLGTNLENLTGTAATAQALTGNVGANRITAGGANDTINGAGGSDTIDGGLGTDVAQFGFARTAYTASQSAGVITLTHTASGTVATISNVENFQFTDGTFTAAQLVGGTPTGTAGNDTLTGTSGADNLSGLGGNDSISGLDGNDTLDGGTGTDTLIGGLGNDVYVVDVAADVVTEAASAGTDEVRTALANYTLGTNLETLTGTAATGQALTGNTGANRIAGLGGNDTLDGGTGADTLVGGLGNDVYVVDVATDVVTEAASAGTDEARTALASYTLGTNLENLTGTAATAQALTGNASANRITAGGANDTINGAGGSDTIDGGLGTDVAQFGFARTAYTASQSAGVITLTHTASSTVATISNVENFQFTDGTFTAAQLVGGTPTGTAGNDTLTGTSGPDNLSGLGGNDSISGLDGNDTLDGGTGTDTLVGGLGNDIYLVDVATDVVTEAASAGTDEVRTALASYTLGANLELLTGTSATGQVLTGNAAANLITGLGGDDTFDGGAGADTFVGGSGWDRITYTSSAVGITLDLAVPANSTGNAAGDTFSGIEVLEMTEQADRFVGGASDDRVFGFGGADTLLGGDGDDALTGGLGADQLDGGNGWDVANYYWENAAVRVDLSNPSQNTGVAIGDTFLNIERFQLTDLYNDQFTGAGADDFVSGGGGQDTLSGGAGYDIIEGEEGSDRIDGGADDDQMWGGDGADTFVFGSISGDDLIFDFTPGQDMIEISGIPMATSFSQVVANGWEADGNTIIDFGGRDGITLVGVSMSQLSAADFRFL